MSNLLPIPNFDLDAFRQQFPLLSKTLNSMPIYYFDNAATTQKMSSTITAIQQYYENDNANVHRGSYTLSAKATSSFEEARERVSEFINAKHPHEIIWTKGATEAINLVANAWGRKYLNPGDEIVVSQSEHHANIVPWQLIAEQTGAIIKVIDLTNEGRISVEHLKTLITENTKIVSFTHVSNVIGKENDNERIISCAKQVGALTLIDGAQAVAHTHVDVQKLNCDFYVFSSHKLYGPTGLGVLYGKTELLDNMPPFQSGGEMVDKVSFSGTTFNKLPFKFEPGTPNISGVIGFNTALQTFNRLATASVHQYEQDLTRYTYGKLAEVEQIMFVVQGQPDIPIFSFVIKGLHNQDVAAFLDTKGIAVRCGYHCAMPLMSYLQFDGCIRVSLTAYNTVAEVDYLIEKLQEYIITELRLEEALPQNNRSTNPHGTGSGVDLKYGSKQGESIFLLDRSKIKTDIVHKVTMAEVIEQFSDAKSWDAKHRLIMLYSKQLKRLSKDRRTSENEITGCESKAWLVASKTESGQYSFESDSDAKVIRGLLFITTLAYQSVNAKEVTNFNIQNYFNTLGLLQHLSPSRSNGLHSIVEKIKKISN